MTVTSSPAEVLARIGELEVEIATVRIGPAKVGRLTGWVVDCADCGSPRDGEGRPKAVGNRRTARAAAEAHIRTVHGNFGRIVERR